MDSCMLWENSWGFTNTGLFKKFIRVFPYDYHFWKFEGRVKHYFLTDTLRTYFPLLSTLDILWLSVSSIFCLSLCQYFISNFFPSASESHQWEWLKIAFPVKGNQNKKRSVCGQSDWLLELSLWKRKMWQPQWHCRNGHQWECHVPCGLCLLV